MLPMIILEGAAMGDRDHGAVLAGEPRRASPDLGRMLGSTVGGHRPKGDGACAPEREPKLAGVARLRLRHDIKHELATMSLLASLLATGDDIGDLSRKRAFQLLKECRWLDELLRAYDDADVGAAKSAPAERLRVDVLAGEVLAALRLIHATHVEFIPSEAWTCAHPLALRQALRNVLENAFRAAGPSGHVRVRVAAENGAAVVQVDDDGPGFGAAPAGLGSLGLSIVRDALDSCGGWLELSTSDLGGGRVRLHIPAPPPVQPSSVAVLESLESLKSPPAPTQTMAEPQTATAASAALSGSWNSEAGGARTGL